MSDIVDQEIEAIKTILKTLQDLGDDARKNVIEYVLKRIGFSISTNNSTEFNSRGDGDGNPHPDNSGFEGTQHIKRLKEEKQPNSALEMVVLIAYYLQFIAEEEKRKDRVGVSDLKTWFRIADYPLPSEMKFIVVNAKNAGYIDSVGNGEYKLNDVGYNHIKHSLPRQESGGAKRRTAPVRKKNSIAGSKKKARKAAKKK